MCIRHTDSRLTHFLSLVLLTLLVDCLAITGRGTQQEGAIGMVETPEESQGVMQGSARMETEWRHSHQPRRFKFN